MSRLLCCLRARRPDMGAALSLPLDGDRDADPPTMADVIRERKKKTGGAALGTLRRRLGRRARDGRSDRGCEHARFIRSVVASWRPADVFLLGEELEAGAALRDLATQAELAREPAPALHAALPALYARRWRCDVELAGRGWALGAHRAVLAARSEYLRGLLQRYPPECARVPLDGPCAALARAELDAALRVLYGGDPAAACTCARRKYDGNDHCDGDLDLVDNTTACGVTCGGRGAARALALLGATRDPLTTSMRYLLDSGEMSDAKLVFRVEGGCGAAYGFRTAASLPCHRVVLAARSRFFRSVMSRRGAGGGAVCVDEKVLPRRFARALLHAAYTDQVDLSLIGRSSTAPAGSTSSNTTSWGGGGGGSRGGARLSPAALEDVFTLYEIARFLEMPIVVQGCEDALAEALAPDTLPLVLRWSSAPHASQWLHRQAMRYLRDEFVSIVSAGGAALPASALASALASPFLQASELGALRALLRWGADHKHKQREPNVVWHTAHSVSRRGARRRELGDAALRDVLAPLLQHVRLEHVPPDNDLLQQLTRRGILPGGVSPEAGSAAAWLGRGPHRPARCFLPYLDEIKALLEEQTPPEAELARARRARHMHPIPDTLYMVVENRSAPRADSPALGLARACVGAGAAAALRARVRELRAAPPARLAATLATNKDEVDMQIALRCVRELSLPDACAELVLRDMDDACDSPPASESPRPVPAPCCRAGSAAGSLRTNSSRSRGDMESAPTCDNSRSGTCSRREQAARADSGHHSSLSPCVSGVGGAAGTARLSAAVPDVAMAPNANTHLLTHRDYFRHPPPWEYGGVVLQLDLGDGATHTPRPGSRAARNSAGAAPRTRDHAHVAQAMSCLRARADEDELRAAIELSVMRAYSSFRSRAEPPRRGATLPARRDDPPQHGSSPPRARAPRAPRGDPTPLRPPGRVSPSPSPSPRRRDYPHPHHDYRVEGASYGGSASASRSHSPTNYA